MINQNTTLEQSALKQNSTTIQNQSKQNQEKKQSQEEQQEEIPKSYIKTETLLCSQSNQATQFCFNKKCTQKNSYICCNHKCNCRKQHKLCSRGCLQGLLSMIYLQIQQTQAIKLQIEDIINKAIDQLSQLKQKFIAEVDQKIKYSHLSSLEKQFFDINEDKKNYLQFSSSSFSDLWNIINEKSDPNNRVNKQAVNHLDTLKKNIKQKIKTTNQQIDYSFVNQYGIEISFYQQKKKPLEKLIYERIQIQRLKSKVLYLKSNVLETAESVQTLMSFFPNKFKNIMRIFKASQHNFNIGQFYQKCGNDSYTIIICRTNNDKIIGGYSPVCFNSNSRYSEQKVTNNESSFLFSISNNDKFVITSYYGVCIYRQSDKKSIKFGDHQLTICNYANTNKQSRTSLNMFNFKNQAYQSNEIGYERFNGDKTPTFLIKQWQAWKVQFM